MNSIQSARFTSSLVPKMPKYKSKVQVSDDEEEKEQVVSEIQLPRKITLFRVVMERKLGIDWEHPPEEDIDEANSEDERESRESFQSVQTNQIIDGGYEGVDTEIDEYSHVDKFSVYKRQPVNNLMTS